MEREKKRGTENGNGNEKGIQALRGKEFDKFRRGQVIGIDLRFFPGMDKHISARAHYHESKGSKIFFFSFLELSLHCYPTKDE